MEIENLNDEELKDCYYRARKHWFKDSETLEPQYIQFAADVAFEVVRQICEKNELTMRPPDRKFQ